MSRSPARTTFSFVVCVTKLSLASSISERGVKFRKSVALYGSSGGTSDLFMHLLQVAAFGLTVLGSAGAFAKSKNQEWPVYEISGLRFFADP